MILGFKKQFIEPILNGSKIHTIREDKHDRWEAGNKIHFATGTRTKNYNQFHEGTCFGVEEIKIRYPVMPGWTRRDPVVTVHGEVLSNEKIEILAKNDGFGSIDEFFAWFDSDFKGKIIHWTEFRYDKLFGVAQVDRSI